MSASPNSVLAVPTPEHLARYVSPAAVKAWAAAEVGRAIARGELTRPAVCSECGGPGRVRKGGGAAIEAHHDDYSRPLDVRWLCHDCHQGLHEWETRR